MVKISPAGEMLNMVYVFVCGMEPEYLEIDPCRY